MSVYFELTYVRGEVRRELNYYPKSLFTAITVGARRVRNLPGARIEFTRDGGYQGEAACVTPGRVRIVDAEPGTYREYWYDFGDQ